MRPIELCDVPAGKQVAALIALAKRKKLRALPAALRQRYSHYA